MVLVWLIATGQAGDVWRAELDDGTVVFTDSPTHSGYTQFDVDGPPPQRASVPMIRSRSTSSRRRPIWGSMSHWIFRSLF